MKPKSLLVIPSIQLQATTLTRTGSRAVDIDQSNYNKGLKYKNAKGPFAQRTFDVITLISLKTKQKTCRKLRQASRAWRRPTLPGPCGPSTIGAGGLNGRVRDGNAWFPSAIATKQVFF